MVAVLSPTEGQLPGGHLVENGSKREQIGSGIQFFRPRLLRRHVSNRAERGTGAGEMIRVHRTRRCVERSNVARRTARQTDLRQSKVQNLGVATLGDENVRRLDVAVDDAFCVGCVKRVRNLDGERQN